MYLWLKFFHIFFVVSWFAGLFYLPRIFVNLSLAQHPDEYARLLLMAKKLYKFMTPWAVGALFCGAAMFWFYTPVSVWIYGKICIGILLAVYHGLCRYLLVDFEKRQNTRGHKWYRVFNELPVFALLAALYFVLFKPV